MKRIALLLTVLVSWWSDVALAAPAWAPAEVRQRVAADGVVAVHVVVPLCSNAQIHCGGAAFGRPGDLRTNLYWGAIFGAKRFLGRLRGPWALLPDQVEPPGVLERVAFRRRVSGKGWGRLGQVEVLVVLDAIHGARIDEAVRRFFRRATEGGAVVVADGVGERRVPVVAAGYAGHNRLMDGLRLPSPRARGRAVATFVLACRSRRYFAEPLTEGGAVPLVTTETLMAPEGYLVEAIASAVGRGASSSEVQREAIAAYAKWQRLSLRAASRVFVPPSR